LVAKYHEELKPKLSLEMIASRTAVLRGTPRRAKLPDGVRIYAIGDIHGCADLLDDVIARIESHLADNPVHRHIEVFLGDYIDRGPASHRVLERLVTRYALHPEQTVCLKGNHETYVDEFIKSPSLLQSWQTLGGLETLMSYGMKPTLNANAAAQIQLAADFDKVLPNSHRQFLSRLRLTFSCGDFFFVHAGIRPGIALERQREEDMLWIREDFLLCEDDFGKIVVHGHSPVLEPEVRSNRINVDTGAYATGRLTCLILERDEIDFL
jgi:serine/threonine protein phosphatase 1